MSILVIGFEDFKKLAKNHRIYYYESETYIDLHFVFEGGMVKTTVMKDTIENVKTFVSDPLFYGAMKIKFNIPVPMPNLLSIKDEFDEISGLDIEDIQTEEVKRTDIQREGVDVDGRTDS